MEPKQIDINQLLQIIGAKEVEIQILRERIQQLEKESMKATEDMERRSTPLQTDPVE